MCSDIKFFRIWLAFSCLITAIQALSLFAYSLFIFLNTTSLITASIQTFVSLWLLAITSYGLVVVGTAICGVCAASSRSRAYSNVCYFIYNSICLFVSYLIQGIVLVILGTNTSFSLYNSDLVKNIGIACIIEGVFFMHNVIVAYCVCCRSDKNDIGYYDPVSPKDHEVVTYISDQNVLHSTENPQTLNSNQKHNQFMSPDASRQIYPPKERQIQIQNYPSGNFNPSKIHPESTVNK